MKVTINNMALERVKEHILQAIDLLPEIKSTDSKTRADNLTVINGRLKSTFEYINLLRDNNGE